MPRPTNLLTIYGRKPVLEALRNDSVSAFRLHLADSNKVSPIIDEIVANAGQRGVDIVYHDRLALSRISKNKKQDQGVALDIVGRNFAEFDEFLNNPPHADFSLIGLDRITNPQNLGMIIRSVGAGFSDGLLIPRKGCARIDSLVIKASAGTVFATPILFCDDLPKALERAIEHGVTVYGLSGNAGHSIARTPLQSPNIFVLGNETEGLSRQALANCSECLRIPTMRNIESLNVAVTAGILAFRPLFLGGIEGPV